MAKERKGFFLLDPTKMTESPVGEGGFRNPSIIHDDNSRGRRRRSSVVFEDDNNNQRKTPSPLLLLSASYKNKQTNKPVGEEEEIVEKRRKKRKQVVRIQQSKRLTREISRFVSSSSSSRRNRLGETHQTDESVLTQKRERERHVLVPSNGSETCHTGRPLCQPAGALKSRNRQISPSGWPSMKKNKIK